MTEVIESSSQSPSNNDNNDNNVESLLKGKNVSSSRLPLSPLHVNGRTSTTTTSSESPRSLGSPTHELDEMGSSKHSEDLDITPKSSSSSTSNQHSIESDNFFHMTGRDRSRSHAVTAAETKAVGLVSLTDDAEEAALEQTWLSNQAPPNFDPPLDVSGTVSEEVEPEEMLPDVTLEIIERLARVEKQYDELIKRVAHMEDDMSETKGRATEFGQRMMKWKEEQETINQQQQQVIATCIKQVVGLTGQLGGIAQPGFIDTISEQLAKGMTSEVFELRKELKNAQLQFEEFKFQTEQKEKKRQTEFQLQLDNFKDKLERKYPGKTLLDASLIPRLRTGKLPGSAKKTSQSISRIPRLRGGPMSPGGPSPPNSIPPSPNPKLPIPNQPRPAPRSGARSPIKNTSHTPSNEKTPVAEPPPRSSSRGRRGSLERTPSTNNINTSTPSYATPTSSSKRRNSLERTPSYSTPATEKRMSLSKQQVPPLGRSGSIISQTPARQTPTTVRATAQTPRNRSNTVTPQSAESSRPRRVSLPSPAQNNGSKTTTPLAVASKAQAKPQQIVSPPN